jgi:hypothetical protein
LAGFEVITEARIDELCPMDGGGEKPIAAFARRPRASKISCEY